MNQNSYTKACRDRLWIRDPNLPLFLRRRVGGQISSCLLEATRVLLFSKVWPVTEGAQEDLWPNIAGSYALPPT